MQQISDIVIGLFRKLRITCGQELYWRYRMDLSTFNVKNLKLDWCQQEFSFVKLCLFLNIFLKYYILLTIVTIPILRLSIVVADHVFISFVECREERNSETDPEYLEESNADTDDADDDEVTRHLVLESVSAASVVDVAGMISHSTTWRWSLTAGVWHWSVDMLQKMNSVSLLAPVLI